jgi:two-component system response regulator CpxR
MSKIILVDDDRTNTTLIKRLLEMDGFTVLVCPDVQRAKEASLNGVDAFVIDCNLSYGDDGIDLLVAIRNGSTAAESNIPVIMTSGDDRRHAAAEQAGATRFLIKPYSPGVLSTQLSEMFPQES